jgi:diguanylate cyclase (GGDEF)-like protein
MKKLIKTIKDVVEAQRCYFTDCGAEIAARNIELVRIVCWTGIALYALYYSLTEIFFSSWGISLIYGIYVPVLAALLIWTDKKRREGPVPIKSAMKVTMLTYVATMAELIAISVFPHPNVPAAFFPLFLVAGPVMFILPIRRHMTITAVSFVTFVCLVLAFKQRQVWQHELFETVTAFIMAMLVIVMMTKLRVQSESLKSKYYNMSRQDGLTGILNKSAGFEAARAYIRDKQENDHFAILFVDIDDFKKINDTYGHIEGDYRLKDIGAVLESACRRDDIVCRFGGDEFMVLLKNVEHPEIAEQKADVILDAIHALSERKWPGMTCSIGICFAGGREDIESYVEKADEALYKTKQKGKNSCVMVMC